MVSAHRMPDAMIDYGRTAADRGLAVIIAGAGGAAHLPGMLAAVTPLPVIGVPVPLKYLDGMDSLLSIVQMPAGVPVATVAIGNARNAGLLAVRILAAGDQDLRRRMVEFQDQLRQAAEAKGAGRPRRRPGGADLAGQGDPVRPFGRRTRPGLHGDQRPGRAEDQPDQPGRRRPPGTDVAATRGPSPRPPSPDGPVGAVPGVAQQTRRRTARRAGASGVGGPVPEGRAVEHPTPPPLVDHRLDPHPVALVRWIRSIRQICTSWISQVSRTSSPPPAARPGGGSDGPVWPSPTAATSAAYTESLL